MSDCTRAATCRLSRSTRRWQPSASRRLNVPADGPFVRVDERARAWAGELAAARRQPPTGVPLRLLETAAHLLPDLLASTKPVLLHTDLHYENVLEADRETWLAIDPKPMVGDAAYEVAPVLWNRGPEATGADHLADHLRRRADGVTEAAAMDRERVAAWVVVREAVEALEATRSTPDTDWRDVSVTIGEAFLPPLG